MSEKPKSNKLIFKVVFIVFIAIVLAVLYDMSSKTTAPWQKKKQIERAIE